MNIPQAIDRRRRRQEGMITVIFIALLGLMLVLVMVETRSLFRLHQEVKLLEKQQIQRLAHPATNAVPNAAHP